MKRAIVLTIGYQQFLLPDEKGLQTIINTLMRAEPIKEYWIRGEKKIVLDSRASAEIQIQKVPPGTRIVTTPDQDGDATHDEDEEDEESVAAQKQRQLPMSENYLLPDKS